MTKNLLLCSVFLSSSLFADGSEHQTHDFKCKNAELQKTLLHEEFIPSDPSERHSCKTDDDCTFHMEASWRPAEAINRSTADAYRQLHSHCVYSYYAKIAKGSCGPVYHTTVIYPRPSGAHCENDKCAIGLRKGDAEL